MTAYPPATAKADPEPTIGGRTEDRTDLGDLGEDLPPSLPGMRPARFEEVARQERSAYRSLLVPLRELRRKVFRLLRLEDQKALRLRRKFEWDAYTQVKWDRAIREFLVETQGHADIQAAAKDWYFSEAALPTEWRLGTRIGIDRATLITGAEEAATAQVNERFMRAFGDHAFERLSDSGRSRLGLMLDGPDVPGGSIRSIIEGAVSSGENPLTTARVLSERFDQYEKWEFTRLTRTEVAFAQEAGIREELRGEGFREIEGFDYPPWHPNSGLPGLLIECPGGQRRIEDIRVGDLVFTGQERAKYVLATKAIEYVGAAVHFDRGGLTAEHPVLCEHGRWLRADERWPWLHDRYEGPVYDIEVAEDETFVTNGIVAHNCCCSTTVDMETGLVLPSVSPSACELCQAARLNATILIPEAERGRPFAQPTETAPPVGTERPVPLDDLGRPLQARVDRPDLVTHRRSEIVCGMLSARLAALYWKLPPPPATYAGGYPCAALRDQELGDVGESLVNQLLGSHPTYNKAPFDGIDDKGKRVFEIKTKRSDAIHQQIRMGPDAKSNKTAFLRETGYEAHTIMVNAPRGEGPIELYWKEGYGSFRRSSMEHIGTVEPNGAVHWHRILPWQEG